MIFKKINSENYEVQKAQDNTALAFQDVDKKIRGISGNYDLVMPRDAPTTKLPLQMDATGNVTAEIALGVTDGSSAAAGRVGEYLSSIISSPTNYPATNVWGDLTSLSLTPGDWDVTVKLEHNPNGATLTDSSFGLGTASGGSSAGVSTPATQATAGFFYGMTSSLPSVRVSISATATYYLKYKATYSAGTPRAFGMLSARRVR